MFTIRLVFAGVSLALKAEIRNVYRAWSQNLQETDDMDNLGYQY